MLVEVVAIALMENGLDVIDIKLVKRELSIRIKNTPEPIIKVDQVIKETGLGGYFKKINIIIE